MKSPSWRAFGRTNDYSSLDAHRWGAQIELPFGEVCPQSLSSLRWAFPLSVPNNLKFLFWRLFRARVPCMKHYTDNAGSWRIGLQTEKFDLNLLLKWSLQETLLPTRNDQKTWGWATGR